MPVATKATSALSKAALCYDCRAAVEPIKRNAPCHGLQPSFSRSAPLLTFTPAFAGVNSWTTAGPPGGFFRDVEQSTTDSNVYYAAYSRSVFRSTDGAVTWQAVWHSESEVVDIAVDPTDGNRFYVAALEGGVWRSEDGGQTMQQIFRAPPDMVWSVGVGGADGKTVY